VKPIERLFQRLFMRIHVALFRLTGGRVGGRIFGMAAMVLTTRGRKSGQDRATPLTYFPQPNGAMLLVASNGGQPTHPAWYHNLMVAGGATVHLPDRTMRVTAELVPPEQYEPLWAQVVAAAPLYEGYRRKTSRIIPLLRLVPER
jgi:deazaflavin-dependent oxidoreductase (nitroreductase family)